MSPPKKGNTLSEIYDNALRYARDKNLPEHIARPKSSSEWPDGHLQLLARYHYWLESGGASPHTIRLVYLIMAGHILGLNLKPESEINLDSDLKKAMDYVHAKELSRGWTNLNRNAMEKFRRFLMNERGMIDSKITAYDTSLYTVGFPEWLVRELTAYQQLKQENWRISRQEYNVRRFWNTHLKFWRFVIENYDLQDVSVLTRKMVNAFVDEQLEKGAAARGINVILRSLHAFLDFLQEREFVIKRSVMRFPCLKEPDPLPKFLTDEQVKLLRDAFEQEVQEAKQSNVMRDALLNRAFFYLLWQSALRLGELEELRLEDLDLAQKRLIVRKGKGIRDRTVYMTDATVHAVKGYLTMRGLGPTDHVFFYRNQPVTKGLVGSRIKDLGKRLGFHVSPHRLRHTCATQLLNAGCRITSIQKFLGHKTMKATLIYARVHDQTVAKDFFSAMDQIEQRISFFEEEEPIEENIENPQKAVLLSLVERLSGDWVSQSIRLEVVGEIQGILGEKERRRMRPPPNFST